MAYEMIDAADQQHVLKILESHPNYGKDFSPPKNAKNWPDTARDYSKQAAQHRKGPGRALTDFQPC